MELTGLSEKQAIEKINEARAHKMKSSPFQQGRMISGHYVPASNFGNAATAINRVRGGSDQRRSAERMQGNIQQGTDARTNYMRQMSAMLGGGGASAGPGMPVGSGRSGMPTSPPPTMTPPRGPTPTPGPTPMPPDMQTPGPPMPEPMPAAPPSQMMRANGNGAGRPGLPGRPTPPGRQLPGTGGGQQSQKLQQLLASLDPQMRQRIMQRLLGGSNGSRPGR